MLRFIAKKKGVDYAVWDVQTQAFILCAEFVFGESEAAAQVEADRRNAAWDDERFSPLLAGACIVCPSKTVAVGTLKLAKAWAKARGVSYHQMDVGFVPLMGHVVRHVTETLEHGRSDNQTP